MTAEKMNITLLPASLSQWAPEKPPAKQIAVLMSGGVDSSIAAYLLKEQGWAVLGVTMSIPVSCKVGPRGCCGADAALVCGDIGIPHRFLDVGEAFRQLIVQRFHQSYAKGETPNPCIDCNTLLKFSLVWDFLEKEFGIEHLATGHYARVIRGDNDVRLGRARDKTKDQSYFLYGIAREKLERFVLPLGELAKAEVRGIAERLGLSVADKAESMELCFAGEGDYRAALPEDQAEREGEITNMQGEKIGTHKGVSNYTLGQRKGIGFAGGKPLYVGRIEATTNTIALGTREEVSFAVIGADCLNVLIGDELEVGRRLLGKIRSYGDPRPCEVAGLSETGMTVEFDEPQFAPSPGQRLVLYDQHDNIVVGGTIVRRGE
ncbi:MAG: tRNA 2-thiouridine(34) synthase MnmA [Phycisphaerae bacterium]|nr:tRNA 2-thiouridine(34) synthase MnmA [Phycisphaerae bacterium]